MSLRILVVDAAPFARRILRKIFAEQGWEVVGEAGSGLEAIDRYPALRPDVVTMGINMPEMDGIAATRSIVGLDGEARVIICSALGQKDMVMGAILSGARDFIVKPFRKDRVVQGVRGVLAKAA